MNWPRYIRSDHRLTLTCSRFSGNFENFVKMAEKFLEVAYVQPTPSYITLTSYEASFPLTYWRHVWGQWWHLSAYAAAIYVVLVFGGRYIMSSRAPFKLNRLLTVWNIALASMSIYAFARVAPEFFNVLLGPNGFHNSICEWWGWLIWKLLGVIFVNDCFLI